MRSAGASRRLARRQHPDISHKTGAADRFNTVSEAYQVLHDPDKRGHYDAHHHVPAGGGGSDAVDLWRRATNRPPKPRHLVDRDFVGGERFAADCGSSQALVSGKSVEAILELSPREAALAATIAVTLTDRRGNHVRQPAGIRDGQRIWIEGAGRRPRPAECPGELLPTVRIRPTTHPHT